MSVYLTSANAVAKTGEIVNIDGNGNRVAETSFGHDRVYFVVGRNKVVATFAEAPNFEVARICRVTTVFDAAPLTAKYEVVLVDQNLGY